jgi:hypothetical protein
MTTTEERRDPPETKSQAQRWEGVKNKYLAAGLCLKCASQEAWGHQIGFARLEYQPCSQCEPLVAEFPVHAANGWRKIVLRPNRPKPAHWAT